MIMIKQFYTDLFFHALLFLIFSQNRGHNIADLDPLGILDADLNSVFPAELSLNSYKLGRSMS